MKRIFLTLILAVLVIAGAFVTLDQAAAQDGYNVPCYGEQGGAKRVAANGCTYEFQAGSVVSFANTPAFGNGLAMDGTLRLAPAASITATDATTITVSGSYLPLTAASEVTPTLAAGEAGNVVILVNTSNQTINLADSGTLRLANAVALGQYDTLMLISDGTAWNEVSRSNN